MSKHTQEPWVMNCTDKYANNAGLAITNEDGSVLIAEVSHDLSDKHIDEYCANAERLIICVNYCEGMTNEEMEGNKILGLVRDMEIRAEATGEEIERLKSEISTIQRFRIEDATSAIDDYNILHEQFIKMKSERDDAVKALKELGEVFDGNGSPNITWATSFITDTLTKIGGHND